MADITMRPATRADFLEFHGKLPPKTCHAIAGEDDSGRVKGVGGYYLVDNFAIAFLDVGPETTKRDVVIGCRAFLEFVKDVKLQVVAGTKFDNPVVLKHLGFEPFGPFWILVR